MAGPRLLVGPLDLAHGGTLTQTLPARALTRRRAILYGTLAVGTFDILDAFVFFGTVRDVPPIRILQSVASGVLGRAAYEGGWGAAALGLTLHFTIAFGIVTTFFLVSRRWRILAQHPFVFGPLYGLVVYAVMNLVVVPLSAAVVGHKTWPVIANGLMIHMLGVGLPSAVFVKAAGFPAPVQGELSSEPG